MKAIYLILAVAGALVPYLFFIQHFSSAGFGLGAFAGALFSNPASGGFTSDLLISSVVFWIFMFRNRRRGEGPAPTLFVTLNLLIGLSCAFPAYLYARERALS